jgi:hypothetical protein
MSILFKGILPSGGGGGGGGGIPEAPLDGKTYGRRNAGWVAVETSRYTHNQATAATAWNIQHNLGSKPVLVNTFNSLGEQIIGEPDFINSTLNQLIVYFSSALAGKAYINTLM